MVYLILKTKSLLDTWMSEDHSWTELFLTAVMRSSMFTVMRIPVSAWRKTTVEPFNNKHPPCWTSCWVSSGASFDPAQPNPLVRKCCVRALLETYKWYCCLSLIYLLFGWYDRETKRHILFGTARTGTVTYIERPVRFLITVQRIRVGNTSRVCVSDHDASGRQNARWVHHQCFCFQN